jgi:hypothetical protein
MVGSGSITGLPDTDKAYFDFDIKELVSTAKDVNFLKLSSKLACIV